MTLFTSEKNKKKLLIIVLAYVGITAFIALFGAVYEQFSHNVDTLYMWCAWVWVFAFGLVPHVVLYFVPLKRVPGILSGCVYNFGVAMITTRSLYIGVVTIANQPNEAWEMTYLIVSLIFLIGGVALYITGLILDKINPPKLEDSEQ